MKICNSILNFDLSLQVRMVRLWIFSSYFIYFFSMLNPMFQGSRILLSFFILYLLTLYIFNAFFLYFFLNRPSHILFTFDNILLLYWYVIWSFSLFRIKRRFSASLMTIYGVPLLHWKTSHCYFFIRLYTTSLLVLEQHGFLIVFDSPCFFVLYQTIFMA